MSRLRNRARASDKTTPAKVFPRPTPEPARSRETWLGMLLIAAATALAYSNTFDASFQFDDFPNIVENPGLHDLRNLWPPIGQRWLGFLSFALNYHFGRLEVFGYHLVNLVIHVCNGLLVFWLSAITLRTPAVRDAEAGPLVRGYLPLVAGVLFADRKSTRLNSSHVRISYAV